MKLLCNVVTDVTDVTDVTEVTEVTEVTYVTDIKQPLTHSPSRSPHHTARFGDALTKAVSFQEGQEKEGSGGVGWGK